MNNSLHFVHIRASTTIGIVSEILRLALIRANYLAVPYMPIRIEWLKPFRRSVYPTVISHSILAPMLTRKEGVAISFEFAKAFLDQLFDDLRNRFRLRATASQRVPKGQYSLYFSATEGKIVNVPEEGRVGELRRLARAVRNFGPVTLPETLDVICQKKLEILGVAADEWFVCLHVRTSTFHSDGEKYRNSSFGNYIDAIDLIIGLGGKVIRMGEPDSDIDVMYKGGLINYPDSMLKSEQMDLYLIKHCKFYIGTTSGILDTAYLFQTPTLCTNATHFDFRSSGKYDKVLFKGVVYKRTNTNLNFYQMMVHYEEIMHHGWQRDYLYVENSSEQILAATKEFIYDLHGNLKINNAQWKARRQLIRKRLSVADRKNEGKSMLAASIAFSRCHISSVLLSEV